MNTIQDKWDKFSSLVISKDAPAVQVTEMRLAFYAGVSAMIDIQFAAAEPYISEEGAVAILQGVNEEVGTYFNERLRKRSNARS